jgi:hypothetical protein
MQLPGMISGDILKIAGLNKRLPKGVIFESWEGVKNRISKDYMLPQQEEEKIT